MKVEFSFKHIVVAVIFMITNQSLAQKHYSYEELSQLAWSSPDSILLYIDKNNNMVNHLSSDERSLLKGEVFRRKFDMDSAYINFYSVHHSKKSTQLNKIRSSIGMARIQEFWGNFDEAIKLSLIHI